MGGADGVITGTDGTTGIAAPLNEGIGADCIGGFWYIL